MGQKLLRVLAPPPEEFRLDISNEGADRILVVLVPKSNSSEYHLLDGQRERWGGLENFKDLVANLIAFGARTY